MRGAWCVSALVMMLLAGCADQEPTLQEESTPEEGDQLDQRYNATVMPEEGDPATSQSASATPKPGAQAPPPTTAPTDPLDPLPTYTRDDWFILPVEASPEGGLASFRFVVPDGATVPHWIDDERQVVSLEVVPLLEDVSATEWLFGRVYDGEPQPFVGITVGVEAEFEGTVLYQSSRSKLPTGAFFTQVEDVEDGDELHLLAGIKAPQGSAGFAFRFLDADPSGDIDERPSEDADQFMERVEGQGWVARAKVEATGFQYAGFGDVRYLPYSTFRYTIGPVEMEDRSVNVAGFSANSQYTVGSSRDGPRGYTAGGGTYFSNTAAGTWNVAADARGSQWAAEGAVAQLPYPASTASSLLGYPLFTVTADGEGSSAVDFTLDVPAEPTEWRYAYFAQLDLDATIEELTGIAPEDGFSTYTGLLGFQNGDLVLEQPGSSVRALGVAPPAPL